MKKTKFVEIHKVTGNSIEETRDEVILEVPYSIYVNDKYITTLFCSPENLEYLATGFLFTQKIIKSKQELKNIEVVDEKIKVNVSLDIKTIVKKTSFVYQLTELPEVEKEIKDKIFDLDKGIYSMDKDNNLIDLDIPSVLLIDKYKDKLISEYKDIYFSGIITDKLLDLIINQKSSHNYRIIVKDFTKIFSSQEKTELFIRKGGRINVVNKTNLIAITVNPTSTIGYNLNSDELIDRLKQVIPIPIYNIKD